MKWHSKWKTEEMMKETRRKKREGEGEGEGKQSDCDSQTLSSSTPHILRYSDFNVLVGVFSVFGFLFCSLSFSSSVRVRVR